MTVATEFKKLVEESALSIYVDQIEERDYGCVYHYDGKLECAIVKQNDKFVDLADINIASLDNQMDIFGMLFDSYTSYASVKDLAESMIRDVTHYTNPLGSPLVAKEDE